ncbi:TPR domain protein [unidentified eubacterium SCB49]|nr:TPR domain protein [unidentified eubacterium SCB49]
MTNGLKKDIMINFYNTNTMKKNLVLLLTAFTLTIGGNVLAQTSEDCTLKGSLFIEAAKAKNYDEAIKHYAPLVAACPTYSLAVYQYGEKMFSHFIKAGDNSKVNDMVTLYNDRLRLYPEKTDAGEVQMDIVQLKYDAGLGTKMEQYQAYEEVFNNHNEAFKSPKSLYTYFSLAVDLNKEGAVPLADMFDLYDAVTQKLEAEEGKMAQKIISYSDKEEAGETLTSREKKNYAAYEKNLGIFGKVRGSVDAKLGTIADCENLIPLYSKDYEANKNDIDWVNRALSRLNAKDCDDPLFFKLVQQLHTLKPSAKSAYYLGKLAEKDGKSSEALRYFNESAELETNPQDKAKVYYSLAENFRKSGKYSDARKYYNKMLEVKPNAGIAYLKIANMYAASANNCGTTPFEKRAMYWKAADLAKKAGKVDGAIASSANQTASSYYARAPQKAEIFSAGMAGQTVSFKCWVGGSVKVPNL